ncbi:isoprenylcysteine carboxylmethyltransferase family protein [Spirosoma terrae]|uniref:Isoprenylcysteine carboxylmethyltransferase family protein n=1 Tax=Spirosoma terrae TaxID=1968276 RepID=A0A6L9L0I7_9BACT|nr:isoprenylcysteine carboxylmethyltransferase family protein [Spirosoma terrae]NDU94014.1 isoprenylcysteine carboxylmethyltransferase family protein [Spirosoma terrae]
MYYAYILLSWFLFGLIHSLTASLCMKQTMANKLGTFNRYYRLLYNGVAVATFVPVLWLHRTAPIDYVSSWRGSLWLGTLLAGVGLTIAVMALRGYDMAEFVGWPATAKTSDSQELRQSGLLQYVRHPLYTGIILYLLGLLITQPTWSYLILLLAASIYIRIGIHFEEQKLVASFGNAYKQYRQRVPMLIPRFSQP